VTQQYCCVTGRREGTIYERAILLGLGALDSEERAQHPTLWRFVTLYYNIII
jgi:hypothetical protein